MLCQYFGSDSRYYESYVDAATHRMLEAEPGGLAVYDVLVAPGRNPGLPLPPGDGRWVAASFADGGLIPEAAAEDGSDEGAVPDAAEPPAEPEPESEPPAPEPELAEPAEPPEPAEPEDGTEAPAEPGPDPSSLPDESTADEPATDDQAAAEAAVTPEGE